MARTKYAPVSANNFHSQQGRSTDTDFKPGQIIKPEKSRIFVKVHHGYQGSDSKYSSGFIAKINTSSHSAYSYDSSKGLVMFLSRRPQDHEVARITELRQNRRGSYRVIAELGILVDGKFEAVP